jgi:hypothetical protein
MNDMSKRSLLKVAALSALASATWGSKPILFG